MLNSRRLHLHWRKAKSQHSQLGPSTGMDCTNHNIAFFILHLLLIHHSFAFFSFSQSVISEFRYHLIKCEDRKWMLLFFHWLVIIINTCLLYYLVPTLAFWFDNEAMLLLLLLLPPTTSIPSSAWPSNSREDSSDLKRNSWGTHVQLKKKKLQLLNTKLLWVAFTFTTVRWVFLADDYFSKISLRIYPIIYKTAML